MTTRSRNGIRLKISSWARHDPRAIPTAAKGTGMYVNSSLAKVEAMRAGYDEALMCTTSGLISEGTGENVFVVRGGQIFMPPRLGGGRPRGHHGRLGHHHRPRPRLHRDRARDAPDRPLHGRRGLLERNGRRGCPDRLGRRPLLGDGEPGPITREIQETYFAAVRGKADRYKDWLEYVN